MSPPVSFAKATLDYPIYSADFDPYNRGYLVVGGGGGEGRSGVKNKISLLDVSSRATLETAGEIQLTSDEDAVMSMANLASKDGLITFAGINSTTKEREANKNEHLRAFKIEYPPKRRAAQEAEKEEEEKVPEGKISLLSKTNLFTTPSTTTAKKENYQRLLRLSPAQKRESGSKRIGAIATSLNPKSELVVFNATSTSPSGSEIIQRIYPKDGADVNDVDISEDSEGNFAVAYCTDHQVFLSNMKYDFSKKKATSITPADEIRPKWSLPFPDTFSKATRPIIKYVRFLTPDHLLFCSNLPNKKGVELTVLRLYGDGPGEIVLKKKLPSHVKATGGLDVCALDADAATGTRQIVVAVAGHDISISIYTLDYSGPSTSTFSKFRSYTSMRDVHPLQMTKLVFSPFHSPWPSSTTNSSDAIKAPSPQYLRLASTSLANTVVVDTLPLQPLHPRKHGSRYVLAGGSSPILDTTIPILTIGFALLVTLLIFQSYIDAKNGGVVTSTGNTINIIPARLRAALAQVRPPLPPGARVPNHISDVSSALADAVPTAVIEPIRSSAGRLRDLLQHHHHHHHPDSDETNPTAQKAIMIVHDPNQESSLSTEVHSSTEEALHADAEARRWEELSADQREVWKQRLVRAGEWAVEEGEVLLKNVLFREYAGMVGDVAGRVVAG